VVQSVEGDKKTSPLCYRCMYPIVWIPYRYQVLVNGVDEYLKIKLDKIQKHHLEIEHSGLG
jgi:hypothetical protein